MDPNSPIQWGLTKADLFRAGETLILAVIALAVILTVIRPLVRRALDTARETALASQAMLGAPFDARNVLIGSRYFARQFITGDAVQILSGAENLRGTVIRTCTLAATPNSLTSLRADYPDGASAVIFCHTGTSATLPFPVVIPQGVGLSVTGATASAIWLTFEVS